VKAPGAPDWLPDLLEFEWNQYSESIDRAYAVFSRDFGVERTRPTFRGKRMGLKRHPELDGKCATFWHFVTEGAVEADRTPVRERIERIAWPKALIVAADRPGSHVLVWNNQRRRSGHGKSLRWIVALPDFSYVVVLDDRGEFVLPWAAYPVAEDHRRKKLEKEYNDWRSGQNS
jgi:hypothetical protein